MARHRASGHTIGERRNVGCGRLSFFIRTTYLDRICYRPGVMIASAVCFSQRESGQGSAPHILLENPDGAAPPTFHRMFHIRNSAPPPFHSDVSHPAHSIRIFHIRCLTPDGRGGRFNFPGQTYPDPLIALIRRVSQPFCTMPRCSPEASRYVRPTF